MAYTNPSGATSPQVGDAVYVTPMQPTVGMQSAFYGQVVALQDGVTATVRSIDPPNFVHKWSIAVELQYTPVTPLQLGIGRSSQFRNYP